LLPVYQRNYCAGPVLFAVAWALMNYLVEWQARLVLLLSCLFLIPGEGMLRAYSTHLPPFLLTDLAKSFLFAHATWAILAMIVLILTSHNKPLPSASSAHSTRDGLLATSEAG